MTESRRIVFYLFLTLLLTPWFMIQVPQSMNADVAWLVDCAGRILDGGKMSTDAYDNNPPLSLIVYMPPVLAHRLTGIPIEHAVFGYTLIFIILSCAAVHVIASRLKLTDDPGICLLTAVYAIANTILAGLHYGQKDHYLLLGLFPFFLIQTGMILRPETKPPLRWPVSIVGSMATLIKPHFLIVPATLMAVRALKTGKPLQIVRDADFLSLLSGTAIYLLVILAFFPDFVTVILPDTVTLYLPMSEPAFRMQSLRYGMLTVFALLVAITAGEKGNNTMTLSLFCLGGALLSLAAYILQFKGFYHHLLPWTAFFASGLALFVYAHCARRLKNHQILLYLLAATAVALALFRTPLKPDFPKAGDYKNFELTRRIRECGQDCTFFMYNENMAIMHQTALHSGLRFGSRFPSFWFMPVLADNIMKLDAGLPADLTREQISALQRKYADFVAEDLHRYRPDILFICDKCDEGSPFDFYTFSSASPRFADEWSRYGYDSTMTINRRDYYRDTSADFDHFLSYKVYTRKAETR